MIIRMPIRCFTQFLIVFCSRVYTCIKLCFISEEASLVSTEEREERLERRHALQRERASDRCARESAEEREERLSKRRAIERIGNGPRWIERTSFTDAYHSSTTSH